MIGRRGAAALIILACLIVTSPLYALDGGRYGDVKVLEPVRPARGFVIFFTDRNGSDAANDAAAAAIVETAALVVEVNTPTYLKRLDKLNEKCHQLVWDAERLSRQLQRVRSFPNYLTPILAGVGEGGTVAELALTEAPSATIAGAVAVDPSATVASRRPICTNAAVQSGPVSFSYGPVKSLAGYWSVGLTADVPKADRNYLLALRRAGAPVEIQEVSGRPSMGQALRSLIAPHLTMPAAVSNISRLPLIELPVQHRSKLMAVVLSGDGGWRDIDKTIAEDLQQHGVPVVGLDSLRYFWSRKTPDQTAADLAAVIETFAAKWQAEDVALIGYSFGADVLPFAYNRLPEALRSHVVLIALFGLSKFADFEIRVAGWLGLPAGPEALPVAPATAKIPPRLMQCFYGAEESDSACPELAKRGVEVIRTAGGHHFNFDYRPLEQDVVASPERRVGPLPSPEVMARTKAVPRGSLTAKLDSTPFLLAAVAAMLALLLLWMRRRGNPVSQRWRR